MFVETAKGKLVQFSWKPDMLTLDDIRLLERLAGQKDTPIHAIVVHKGVHTVGDWISTYSVNKFPESLFLEEIRVRAEMLADKIATLFPNAALIWRDAFYHHKSLEWEEMNVKLRNITTPIFRNRGFSILPGYNERKTYLHNNISWPGKFQAFVFRVAPFPSVHICVSLAQCATTHNAGDRQHHAMIPDLDWQLALNACVPVNVTNYRCAPGVSGTHDVIGWHASSIPVVTNPVHFLLGQGCCMVWLARLDLDVIRSDLSRSHFCDDLYQSAQAFLQTHDNLLNQCGVPSSSSVSLESLAKLGYSQAKCWFNQAIPGIAPFWVFSRCLQGIIALLGGTHPHWSPKGEERRICGPRILSAFYAQK
ncbi:hypothetical protein COCSUDRAFT_45614 [Coccomyxa subellipsoidea C-169]|uniref:Uncharacterized protein n=1 Tax=Coccomyxa subellipsoidea (strain C-169) TaxID=574566 RepID=I0YI52_COCSC|nr:hypothetical protein COCSUDRAFT_45614 [Coccomyxa subellipsoidea C-169]EIE18071.1 hypothetical protein COCSUDRAFT_45614 [Coccomyxa subellipsoidea C-169]|eukprot:XP_005642615.1 hypothetical protein COCSUDRAFT_45614 [Coccomyxa subellipsoidea C-169]